MAIESELVTADVVEATEFQDLSMRYQVYGVPLTVINDVHRIEGGLPEPMFVSQVMQSAGINSETPLSPSE